MNEEYNKAIDDALNAMHEVAIGGYGEEGWVPADVDDYSNAILDAIRKLRKGGETHEETEPRASRMHSVGDDNWVRRRFFGESIHNKEYPDVNDGFH